MVIELLVLSGLAYAGSRLRPRPRVTVERDQPAIGKAPESPPFSLENGRAIRRDLRLSTASLGLVVSGLWLGTPWLNLCSLPVVLWVSAPGYRRAFRAIGQRRIDAEVLDASLLTICLASGYTLAATLDVLLRTTSRWQSFRAERAFHDTLDETVGKPATGLWVLCDGVEVEMPASQVSSGAIVALAAGETVPAAAVVVEGSGQIRSGWNEHSEGNREVRAGAILAAGCRVVSGRLRVKLAGPVVALPDLRSELEQTPRGATVLGQLGEHNGERTAPWMLGAFALSLPLLGPNRAAVFLTTRFGAHMRQLGPHAALKAIDCGARHKIFIRDIGALEHANGINGIVFEAEVLDHPAARRELQNVIEALRRRRWPLAEAMAKPFALYGLAEDEATGQRLAAEWRLDDYFVEPFEWGRTRLIRNLQQGGRSLCYVGAPRAEATAMKAATLAVAHCPDGLTADTPAQIVLGDKNLTGLVGLFELAAAFEVRQGVNLVTPFGVDLLDVSTTVFLNFSLFFSVVMSHAGLLASAAGSGFAKWEPLPVENSGNSESSPSARVEAESRSISD